MRAPIREVRAVCLMSRQCARFPLLRVWAQDGEELDLGLDPGVTQRLHDALVHYVETGNYPPQEEPAA